MRFEWDAQKAQNNEAKHGVSFPYAARIFLDPYRIEEIDTRQSYGEIRVRTLGMVENRLLVVVHTDRDEAVRIISARRALRYERRRYHELRARP